MPGPDHIPGQGLAPVRNRPIPLNGSEKIMGERSTERLFDSEGNLVVGVGDEIPEGRSDLGKLDTTPADGAYPAGKPDGDDPVDAPVHQPVTEIPLHTPAEQQLVDAGVMKPRDADAGAGVTSKSTRKKPS